MKPKKVIFLDETFTIEMAEYGYDMHKLSVNGETGEFNIRNDKMQNLTVFKSLAKQAIEQYIARREARKTFENWDGKL